VDWYTQEMQGLAGYLGEFGLGVTPVRKTALPVAKAKAPAKVPAKAPVKAPVKAKAPAPAKAKAPAPVKPVATKKTPVSPTTGKAPTKTVKAPPAPKLSAMDKFAASDKSEAEQVSAVVDILRAYGANLPAGQSAYTPAVLAAWQSAAKKKGLDPTMFNRGGDAVLVNKNTLKILRSSKPAPGALPAAKTTPAKKTAAKPAPIKAKPPAQAKAPVTGPAMVSIDIGTAQDLLLRLGVNLGKTGRDGKYGPTTANGWKAQAQKRGIKGNGAKFDRASATTAFVFPATVDALTKAAGVTPTSNGTPVSTPTTSSSATTNITVGTAQDLLLRLGGNLGKAGRDGKYGATTANLWKAQAQKVGVPASQAGMERVSGTQARVRKVALDALTKAAGVVPAVNGEPAQPTPPPAQEEQEKPPPEPAATPAPDAGSSAIAKIVAASTSEVSVADVQSALKMINTSGKWTGRYSSVGESGSWDTATRDALLDYYEVGVEPYRAVWAPALDQLVSADRSAVNVAPAWATNLTALARAWAARKPSAPAAPTTSDNQETTTPPNIPEVPIGTNVPDTQPDALPTSPNAQIVPRPPDGAIPASRPARRARATQETQAPDAPIGPPSIVTNSPDNTVLYVGAAVGLGLLVLMFSGASAHA